MGKNKSTKYLIIIILTIILLSGVRDQNKNLTDFAESSCPIHIRDSVSTITGRKIKIFGSDSIQEFYKNETAVIIVKYLDPHSPIYRKNYYEDGLISSMEYNSEHPKNLVTPDDFYSMRGKLWQQSFYPNSGRLNRQVFYVDTTIITDGNPNECFMLDITYHENGQKSSIGFYGSSVNAQISPVGLQNYFDESGKLTKTANYIHPKDKWPHIIITEYYKNDNRKSEKQYINHAIHDNDAEEPAGTWKYYNEKGELIKTEKYKNGELVKTET